MGNPRFRIDFVSIWGSTYTWNPYLHTCNQVTQNWSHNTAHKTGPVTHKIAFYIWHPNLHWLHQPTAITAATAAAAALTRFFQKIIVSLK
jgi:hypothetical protein